MTVLEPRGRIVETEEGDLCVSKRREEKGPKVIKRKIFLPSTPFNGDKQTEDQMK